MGKSLIGFITQLFLLFLLLLLLLLLVGCVQVQTVKQQPQKAVYYVNDCGLQNCHGLDLICGSNIPAQCDESYDFGDGCREYAYCGKVNGICTLIKEPRFDACRACVEECEAAFDEDDDEENKKMWLCEEECLSGS